MVELMLKAQLRNLGSKGDLNQGRLDKKVPAVLYGFEQDNQSLWFDLGQVEDIYKEAGSFGLVDLQIDGQQPTKVIIKEVQIDPVTDKIIHLDLYKVNLDKPVEVFVPIHLVGEAPAVKALGGTLIHVVNELHVKCLPENIIKEVKVDISGLESFDDVIHVSSLQVPANIEILNDAEQVVTSVIPPRVEEEPEAEEAEAEEAEGEEGEIDKTEEGKEKTEETGVKDSESKEKKTTEAK